ncbi:hypothetical protein EDM53_05280 [Rickettsiales endosymbiont of Peranema trichophorum]|uniref:hypothetical protein n=1 Tax=Rickettsiales endosymbiont of Peranema trichophorum TaxID=2486577 RepID=UPI001022C8AC|nr:hypothetical protein [Rickettsiales endosymbiont of Peranema trichophorum]RZI45424.1 hypothetical protein EDM53_05280 [Rickettsiales endosymbiont of Peranema trichophorum]
MAKLNKHAQKQMKEVAPIIVRLLSASRADEEIVAEVLSKFRYVSYLDVEDMLAVLKKEVHVAGGAVGTKVVYDSSSDHADIAKIVVKAAEQAKVELVDLAKAVESRPVEAHKLVASAPAGVTNTQSFVSAVVGQSGATPTKESVAQKLKAIAPSVGDDVVEKAALAFLEVSREGEYTTDWYSSDSSDYEEKKALRQVFGVSGADKWLGVMKAVYGDSTSEDQAVLKKLDVILKFDRATMKSSGKEDLKKKLEAMAPSVGKDEIAKAADAFLEADRSGVCMGYWYYTEKVALRAVFGVGTAGAKKWLEVIKEFYVSSDLEDAAVVKQLELMLSFPLVMMKAAGKEDLKERFKAMVAPSVKDEVIAKAADAFLEVNREGGYETLMLGGAHSSDYEEKVALRVVFGVGDAGAEQWINVMQDLYGPSTSSHQDVKSKLAVILKLELKDVLTNRASEGYQALGDGKLDDITNVINKFNNKGALTSQLSDAERLLLKSLCGAGKEGADKLIAILKDLHNQQQLALSDAEYQGFIGIGLPEVLKEHLKGDYKVLSDENKNKLVKLIQGSFDENTGKLRTGVVLQCEDKLELKVMSSDKAYDVFTDAYTKPSDASFKNNYSQAVKVTVEDSLTCRLQPTIGDGVINLLKGVIEKFETVSGGVSTGKDIVYTDKQALKKHMTPEMLAQVLTDLADNKKFDGSSYEGYFTVTLEDALNHHGGAKWSSLSVKGKEAVKKIFEKFIDGSGIKDIKDVSLEYSDELELRSFCDGDAKKIVSVLEDVCGAKNLEVDSYKQYVEIALVESVKGRVNGVADSKVNEVVKVIEKLRDSKWVPQNGESKLLSDNSVDITSFSNIMADKPAGIAQLPADSDLAKIFPAANVDLVIDGHPNKQGNDWVQLSKEALNALKDAQDVAKVSLTKKQCAALSHFFESVDALKKVLVDLKTSPSTSIPQIASVPEAFENVIKLRDGIKQSNSKLALVGVTEALDALCELKSDGNYDVSSSGMIYDDYHETSYTEGLALRAVFKKEGDDQPGKALLKLLSGKDQYEKAMLDLWNGKLKELTIKDVFEAQKSQHLSDCQAKYEGNKDVFSEAIKVLKEIIIDGSGKGLSYQQKLAIKGCKAEHLTTIIRDVYNLRSLGADYDTKVAANPNWYNDYVKISLEEALTKHLGDNYTGLDSQTKTALVNLIGNKFGKDTVDLKYADKLVLRAITVDQTCAVFADVYGTSESIDTFLQSNCTTGFRSDVKITVEDAFNHHINGTKFTYDVKLAGIIGKFNVSTGKLSSDKKIEYDDQKLLEENVDAEVFAKVLSDLGNSKTPLGADQYKEYFEITLDEALEEYGKTKWTDLDQSAKDDLKAIFGKFVKDGIPESNVELSASEQIALKGFCDVNTFVQILGDVSNTQLKAEDYKQYLEVTLDESVKAHISDVVNVQKVVDVIQNLEKNGWTASMHDAMVLHQNFASADKLKEAVEGAYDATARNGFDADKLYAQASGLSTDVQNAISALGELQTVDLSSNAQHFVKILKHVRDAYFSTVATQSANVASNGTSSNSTANVPAGSIVNNATPANLTGNSGQLNNSANGSNGSNASSSGVVVTQIIVTPQRLSAVEICKKSADLLMPSATDLQKATVVSKFMEFLLQAPHNDVAQYAIVVEKPKALGFAYTDINEWYNYYEKVSDYYQEIGASNAVAQERMNLWNALKSADADVKTALGNLLVGAQTTNPGYQEKLAVHKFASGLYSTEAINVALQNVFKALGVEEDTQLQGQLDAALKYSAQEAFNYHAGSTSLTYDARLEQIIAKFDAAGQLRQGEQLSYDDQKVLRDHLNADILAKVLTDFGGGKATLAASQYEAYFEITLDQALEQYGQAKWTGLDQKPKDDLKAIFEKFVKDGVLQNGVTLLPSEKAMLSKFSALDTFVKILEDVSNDQLKADAYKKYLEMTVDESVKAHISDVVNVQKVVDVIQNLQKNGWTASMHDAMVLHQNFASAQKLKDAVEGAYDATARNGFDADKADKLYNQASALSTDVQVAISALADFGNVDFVKHGDDFVKIVKFLCDTARTSDLLTSATVKLDNTSMPVSSLNCPLTIQAIAKGAASFLLNTEDVSEQSKAISGKFAAFMVYASTLKASPLDSIGITFKVPTAVSMDQGSVKALVDYYDQVFNTYDYIKNTLGQQLPAGLPRNIENAGENSALCKKLLDVVNDTSANYDVLKGALAKLISRTSNNLSYDEKVKVRAFAKEQFTADTIGLALNKLFKVLQIDVAELLQANTDVLVTTMEVLDAYDEAAWKALTDDQRKSLSDIVDMDVDKYDIHALKYLDKLLLRDFFKDASGMVAALSKVKLDVEAVSITVAPQSLVNFFTISLADAVEGNVAPNTDSNVDDGLYVGRAVRFVEGVEAKSWKGTLFDSVKLGQYFKDYKQFQNVVKYAVEETQQDAAQALYQLSSAVPQNVKDAVLAIGALGIQEMADIFQQKEPLDAITLDNMKTVMSHVCTTSTTEQKNNDCSAFTPIQIATKVAQIICNSDENSNETKEYSVVLGFVMLKYHKDMADINIKNMNVDNDVMESPRTLNTGAIKQAIGLYSARMEVGQYAKQVHGEIHPNGMIFISQSETMVSVLTSLATLMEYIETAQSPSIASFKQDIKSGLIKLDQGQPLTPAEKVALVELIGKDVESDNGKTVVSFFAVFNGATTPSNLTKDTLAAALQPTLEEIDQAYSGVQNPGVDVCFDAKGRKFEKCTGTGIETKLEPVLKKLQSGGSILQTEAKMLVHRYLLKYAYAKSDDGVQADILEPLLKILSTNPVGDNTVKSIMKSYYDVRLQDLKDDHALESCLESIKTYVWKPANAANPADCSKLKDMLGDDLGRIRKIYEDSSSGSTEVDALMRKVGVVAVNGGAIPVPDIDKQESLKKYAQFSCGDDCEGKVEALQNAINAIPAQSIQSNVQCSTLPDFYDHYTALKGAYDAITEASLHDLKVQMVLPYLQHLGETCNELSDFGAELACCGETVSHT